MVLQAYKSDGFWAKQGFVDSGESAEFYNYAMPVMVRCDES